MIVNTKQIKNGLITVEDVPLKAGISRSELERILNIEIEIENEFVGYVLGSNLTEDGQEVTFTVQFENDTVESFEVNIGNFLNENLADIFLNEWLEERRITEWVGGSYYETDFGSLTPSIVCHRYENFHYDIKISLSEGDIPSKKFLPIRNNKNNSVKFEAKGSEYKIQRIPYKKEEELPYLPNFLGSGPYSITEWCNNDSFTQNDRRETIYFNISKIENNTEAVIGVAEFTYFAIWNPYIKSELFFSLDNLAESWGIVGFAAEKYGCELQNETRISPYILLFENIHDEIPHNKELQLFKDDENNLKSLFNSVIQLTSKYIKIPEEDMTFMSISENRDTMFSYYIRVEDVFVNYQRTSKIVTPTNYS